MKEGIYYLPISDEIIIAKRNNFRSVHVYTSRRGRIYTGLRSYVIPLYTKVFTNYIKAYHGVYLGDVNGDA